ncbi:hypothetical protein HV819_02235 [Anaerococcus sp. AGMB00486]|uniref:Uncharacterized protein n=2 Tax=Anaerococcus TaxID=165779 RepID=A0ABX2N804_9FIRM|nr:MULTISPECIES: hypothetical protein [Anaerococcus]MSS77382.1 hypothetical protein [Anaerococcus porci]NVF10817.1 hypothetical protein [Anaerococcus faecalis]
MRTNASVTIIKRMVVNRQDVYSELGTYPCHWEETRGINANRTGRSRDDIDKITCYIPNHLLRMVDVEDLIIRNDNLKEIKQLKTFKEYEKEYGARKITVCDVFDFGSKNMQYTRIGAK